MLCSSVHSLTCPSSLRPPTPRTWSTRSVRTRLIPRRAPTHKRPSWVTSPSAICCEAKSLAFRPARRSPANLESSRFPTRSCGAPAHACWTKPNWKAKTRRRLNTPKRPAKTRWRSGVIRVSREAPLSGTYILREGEYYGVTNDPNEPMVGMGGQHLGPVGSRIVAETLIGVLWTDQTSFFARQAGVQALPRDHAGRKADDCVLARLRFELNSVASNVHGLRQRGPCVHPDAGAG